MPPKAGFTGSGRRRRRGVLPAPQRRRSGPAPRSAHHSPPPRLSGWAAARVHDAAWEAGGGGGSIFLGCGGPHEFQRQRRGAGPGHRRPEKAGSRTRCPTACSATTPSTASTTSQRRDTPVLRSGSAGDAATGTSRSLKRDVAQRMTPAAQAARTADKGRDRAGVLMSVKTNYMRGGWEIAESHSHISARAGVVIFLSLGATGGPCVCVWIFHTAPRPTTYRSLRSRAGKGRFCGWLGISTTPRAVAAAIEHFDADRTRHVQAPLGINRQAVCTTRGARYRSGLKPASRANLRGFDTAPLRPRS